MKVLVTGGLGFIGSYTADLLRESGFSVRVLDNLDEQAHLGRVPEWRSEKDELVRADITSRDVWEKALDGVDYVVHLAGVVGISQSMYQPVRYMQVNAVGTSLMYDVLLARPELRRRIKKIVAASSKTIYGEGSYTCKDHGTVYPGMRPQEQLARRDWNVKCPQCGQDVEPVGITEDKPAQNLSVYALSKYSVERLADMYCRTMGIPTVIFRYFSAYGPRQSLSNPYSGVCAIFISRCKNGNNPVVFEDGRQLRDFVYVQDIARANLLAIENDGVIDGIYNIASGRGTSILDVGNVITGLFGDRRTVDVTQEFRVGDSRSDFGDITRARRHLGFEPRWTLEKGLAELVAWSEKQEAQDKFAESERERKKYFS